MIRLLRVELTRLRWRRAVLLLLALAVVATTVVLVGVVALTRAQTIEELAARNGPQVEQDVTRCLRHPRQYGFRKDAEDLQTKCEDRIAGFYGPSELKLVEQRESGSGPALVALLALLLLLAGTTFVGHDWNTGSMSNQLLFEPRRLRIWAAKAVAVALVAAAVAAVLLTLFWTALWGVASARDLEIPEHAVAAAYKQGVLGTAFVAGAALLGYALTMLLRSTVGSLGLLLGVTFLGIVSVATVGFSPPERLLPWTNFVAYVVGGYTYYSQGPCADFDCSSSAHLISRSDSVVYWVVVLAAVLAVSAAAFRSRDVP